MDEVPKIPAAFPWRRVLHISVVLLTVIALFSCLFFSAGTLIVLTPTFGPALCLGVVLLISGLWLLVQMKPVISDLCVKRPKTMIILSSLTLFMGYAFFPVACDVHESWIDHPNKRCDCYGITISYYPPGVQDGATSDYCIGIKDWLLEES